MSEIIDTCVAVVNSAGRAFCEHAGSMFLQIGVLVLVLLCIDGLLRRRIRATLRYWIWMLVFVKLVLPPSLCVPTGIGYWVGGHVTPVVLPEAPETGISVPVGVEVRAPAEMPPAPSSHSIPGAIKPVEPVAGGSEPLTWQGGLFLLWVIGVLVFAGLVMQRWRFVKGLITRSEAAPDDLLEMLGRCRRRMGVRRKVGLRLSSDTFSPAVCGLLDPTILMPRALLDRLSPEGLQAVLIHELAHVKRGDLWVNSLQTILQAAYFYNPLIWLANAIVRRVREQAVDEMVLVALGAEARSYGNTLIDIAEMAFLRTSPALRLIGVAESRKSFEGRIKHMMTRPMPKSARMGLWGLLTVLAAGAVLLPMAKAQKANEDAAQDAAGNGEHHVSAVPLTDFERTLVQQVIDLAKQVEERYPDKAKHWPAGAALYHLDSQGLLTVWHYRMLGRKAESAEDEVGWGSSQLVDAKGMFYLPDGTPLQSRWRNRDGNGMKDIRIQIGRRVGEGERVGLVHRHALGDEQDLWSRDGGKRTILVVAYDKLPQEVAVRIDRPLRLASWWWGDIETHVQHLDGYDQLHASIPPRDKVGPLLVTAELPAGMTASRSVNEASQQSEDADPRRPGEAFRQYEVNRSVADFPAGEDFSTPEAAYATINRMERDDSSAWKKVSVARLADRFGPDSDRKRTVDPQWTNVMHNARIREVLVWNMTRAAVIAELPQESSDKRIADPFDVRFLQLENGRWLNTGNGRFPSIEAAKTHFMNWMQQETASADAMRDPLQHADEVKQAARRIFENIRDADYAEILSYQRNGRNGKWAQDEWKKKFPTWGLYTVHTDYPSFAAWCSTHFQDNPIVDIQLGDVFIGDALVLDKTGWPTVPYKLTLKDGTILAGNLPFKYEVDKGRGHWHGMEGIDWHLWPSGTK